MLGVTLIVNFMERIVVSLGRLKSKFFRVQFLSYLETKSCCKSFQSYIDMRAIILSI